jgi:DNA-binding NarL/FixJ family response regulator
VNDSETVEAVPILVADDQRSVRDGLAVMLDLLDDISVVAVAADGAEALAAVDQHRPRVALFDLHMPVMDGIEATRRLRAKHPATAVVVLSSYAEDTSILKALEAGACGYLTKNAGRAEIARAIVAAANGQSILDPAAHAAVLRAAGSGVAPSDSELPDVLTRREREVLILIAQGLSNADIAATLFLGANTVKTHISRVFAKTGSATRAQAICYAHEHGLSGRA